MHDGLILLNFHFFNVLDPLFNRWMCFAGLVMLFWFCQLA
jgi:hypothetical protein